MPVLASSSLTSSSPGRRPLASYSTSYSSSYSSSYSGPSSSLYSRSSSTYASTSSARTSSLDRSPYASSSSYHKYSSGYSSASTRPSISSSRTTSTYSSTRTSPSRNAYLSRTSKSIGGDDGRMGGRDAASESRDNYLNGNVKRTTTCRDYSSTTSTPSSSYSSKYRSSTTGGQTSPPGGSINSNGRSKYSSEREVVELPKISERIRSFQASRSVDATPFRSRFLRPSPDRSTAKAANEDSAEDATRPSVSDLRRRYDQNRNHVTTPERPSSRSPPPVVVVTSKPPRGVIKSPSPPPAAVARRAVAELSGSSDSEESGSRTPVNAKKTSPTPDREDTQNPPAALPSRWSKENQLRSSSPSTLSSTSSSDGEAQDGASGVKLSGARAGGLTTSSSRRTDATSEDTSSLTGSPRLAPRSLRDRNSALSGNNKKSSCLSSSDSAGLVGLRNIGNTCFMNSVLQCLSNTRPVLEYVISDEYSHHINTSSSSMNGALIKAFSSVLAELWKKDEDEDDGYSMAVNPTALKSQVQKFAPRFMGYNQQDAQEFLRYLLEGLHEDVNRVAVKPRPIEQDIPDSLSDGEKAAEAWKRYIRREDSRIVDLFVGQLKSTLQCVTCGHCSVTFDPFWDLSLPIPSGRSSSLRLHHCLDLFVKEEILDGDEKPTCSKCQARRKCTKKFTIHKFPQILVLHLKRFSPGERFRKLDASVDFPLTDLDLSAYQAANSGGGRYSYRLYGVINHSGSAYSGHYTASCRHPFTGAWHEYNDSKVSSLTAQRVISSEAYLLFYELETTN